MSLFREKISSPNHQTQYDLAAGGSSMGVAAWQMCGCGLAVQGRCVRKGRGGIGSIGSVLELTLFDHLVNIVLALGLDHTVKRLLIVDRAIR